MSGTNYKYIIIIGIFILAFIIVPSLLGEMFGLVKGLFSEITTSAQDVGQGLLPAE